MTSQHEKPDVAIIGAGIVGISCALNLQRLGLKVTVFDREGPAAGTSFGNGGVLASCGVVPVNAPGLGKNAPAMLLDRDSPLFLRWSYLPKMLSWLLRYSANANPKQTRHVARALTTILHDSLEQHQALASGTGAEKWLKATDYVFFYEDRKAFEKDAYGWGLRKEMGFNWQELEGDEVNDYDPIFQGTRNFAVRFKNHGIITDPGKYVTALADHFQNQGGKLVIAEVDDVLLEDGKVRAVQTTAGEIACSDVVLAAGVWSKPLAEKLGLKVPMETERGYHIELINPSVMPRSPIMLVSGKFVITPMEGRIRCAGIVEFGGLKAPASNGPIELLKRQIHAAIPGIKYDRIEEWMGHRPAPVDSIPFIGPIRMVPGAWTAFGHHHIGLTGGPKTGRMLADMIIGQPGNHDMQPYEPSRFA